MALNDKSRTPQERDHLNHYQQARPQTRALDDRWRLAIRSARLGTWSLDVGTGSADCDEACRELLGVGVDTGLTLDLMLARVYPDDRSLLTEAIERSAAGCGEYKVEFRVVRADGSLHWIESRGRAYASPSGLTTTLIGVNFDITDRKVREQSLRASEERFQHLNESGIIGIAYFTFDGGITEANDAFLRMIQFSRDDLRRGQVRWDRLTPPDWMERTREAVAQFRITGTIQPYEKQYLRKDGSCFWGLFGGARISADQGIAFILDITERKQVEEALRRSNEHLQQFAYAASHDIQEPLRSIRGLIELIAKRYGPTLPAEAVEMMAMVSDAGERMRTLIDDLLAFSRASADDRAAGPVNAQEALSVALNGLQRQIDESLAVIEYGELPVVNADPVRLPQVFQNLISNAIKYRKSSEAPKISVTASMREGQLQFAVRDNGIGFAPENADRIFRIFKRLHGKDVPGNGIGLAISKTIVEQLGGRIWAESQEGKGSTFYFTVPAVPDISRVPPRSTIRRVPERDE